MISTRIIPVLLLSGKGIVKTIKFKKPVYLGDPLNAVKVFNDKEVDELIFLDVLASKKNIPPDYKLIEDIASECFMPVCYGGGISSIEQIKKILSLGIEKVSLNTQALNNPSLVQDAASIFGSQSIVVSIDIKKKLNGTRKVFSHSTDEMTSYNPLEYAQKMEQCGAGELLITSVDRDGMMNGFDIDLIKNIVNNVNIPVIACGGAGELAHFQIVKKETNVAAIAAGSMFVFHGKHKAVLLNYPEQGELKKYLM
jgi:imidazole glycerol-phosphate synthase subunit HisF